MLYGIIPCCLFSQYAGRDRILQELPVHKGSQVLLQAVVSQDVTKKKYCFVPCLDKFEGVYTDERLTVLWGIDEEEWEYIDSRIGLAEAD